MSRRTRTLAITATAGLAGALGFAITDQASANVSASCERLEFVGWPAGPVNLTDLTITVDGRPFLTGPYRFVSPAAPLVLPRGNVVAIATRGTHSWRSSAECELTPAPEPTPPEVTPPPVSIPPPVFTPPGTPPPTTPPPVVKPKPRLPLIAHKTVRTLRAVPCQGAGTRGYSIIRTRVVWTRGGHVVKVKVRTARRAGAVCSPPAVLA